jgi:hypothetical protein
MKKINISTYAISATTNKGINKEWALCQYFGIKRDHHDNVPYNVGSDIETCGMKISVKSPKASLMSGNYCIGCNSFEEIWETYKANTHSDTIAFVTHELDTYFMNIEEFADFVHAFGYLSRESQSNGGNIKIAFLNESKRMRAWFAERVA